MCKATEDKATSAKTVYKSASLAALDRDSNENVSDIQEQGYNDILLDLVWQVLVTEQIHCQEKDIAYRLFVSVLPTGDLPSRATILTGLLAGEYAVMDESDDI